MSNNLPENQNKGDFLTFPSSLCPVLSVLLPPFPFFLNLSILDPLGEGVSILVSLFSALTSKTFTLTFRQEEL